MVANAGCEIGSWYGEVRVVDGGTGVTLCAPAGLVGFDWFVDFLRDRTGVDWGEESAYAWMLDVLIKYGSVLVLDGGRMYSFEGDDDYRLGAHCDCCDG